MTIPVRKKASPENRNEYALSERRLAQGLPFDFSRGRARQRGAKHHAHRAHVSGQAGKHVLSQTLGQGLVCGVHAARNHMGHGVFQPHDPAGGHCAVQDFGVAAQAFFDGQGRYPLPAGLYAVAQPTQVAQAMVFFDAEVVGFEPAVRQEGAGGLLGPVPVAWGQPRAVNPESCSTVFPGNIFCLTFIAAARPAPAREEREPETPWG